MIIKSLYDYDSQSVQKNNKEKSSFFVFSKIVHAIVPEVEIVIGFIKGKFSLTYHGCPIEHVKKRKVNLTKESAE